MRTARREKVLSRFAWLVLLGLLGALVVGAITFDPRTWPGVVGDEATYLMAAQSLARDFDVRYRGNDHQRFVELFDRQPEGLILQSSDGGQSLVYGKPLFYPIFLAPWMRLLPTQGAAVANALLLALAAVFVVGTLRRWLGWAAPLWVASFLFASVTFAHVFWAHADLFMMSLVAIALSLAVRLSASKEEADASRVLSESGIWAVTALLLAVVVLSRPFYLPLFAPFLVIARTRRHLAKFVIAAMVCVVAGLGLTFALQSTWTTYAGERQGYYSRTGFPVDTPPELAIAEWQERLEGRGDNAWVGGELFPFGLDLRVALWNSLYGLAGRHVGFLPYFLPFVLGLISLRSDRLRWSLLLAACAIAGLFLMARPFNFWGGGGALANRYLLPAFPLFWFLVSRHRSVLWPVGVALLSGLALWPTWSSPRGFLRAADGSYRHVSPTVERFLPYETTQSHLKPAGREDFRHGEGGSPLWIKPLSPRLDTEGAWIKLRPGRHGGEILLGAERPLEGLLLIEGIAAAARVVEPASHAAAISSADDGDLGPRFCDGRTLELPRLRSRARHRMWWSRELFYLYQLDLDRVLEDWKNDSGEVWFRIRPLAPHKSDN